MLERQINRLVAHYGLWRLVHICLAAGIVTLSAVFVLELVVPVQSNTEAISNSANMDVAAGQYFSEILQPGAADFQELAKTIRPGLFKASTPLRDKPMAEKTIERIKSQLKLQCIMEIGGEPVAYINIKGMGLKKCCVGDSVSDLFTVLNINRRSVEIKIVEHKVTLTL